MKVIILSDAHGNTIYFDKCMKAIKAEKFDKIIFLGDCFGYMHDGNAILTQLRQMNAHILMGNHEAMLLGKLKVDQKKDAVYGLEIDRKNISDSNLKYVKSLRSELYEGIDNKKILYVHGRPDNPLNGYLYEDDELYGWNHKKYDFIFMGHTHYPYIKKVGTTTYVNVGSCGLPRDNGMAPSYVVFNTQTKEVVIHRIIIDKEDIEKIREKASIHPKVYECLQRERVKV